MERKTKIVCTLGPAVDSDEMIEKMILTGMNVARLNFSHANHDEHLERIERVRRVAKKLGRYVGILADTKGPEIRTGEFENGAAMFNKGDIVKVHKEKILGNKEKFHIECDELYDDISVGDFILIDDGKIRLNVTATTPTVLTCEIQNNGVIKTKKGVNVPNVKLSMPFISKKDKDDIAFCVKQKVDMFALSFVRRREDIIQVKELLHELKAPQIDIIAKIESQEGVDELEHILQECDGVMVARGDLGVEVSTSLVPIYQKKIIKIANEMGKPVITATHMLESMMANPRPTRAEASDVANAILDGSDGIMLSGESAAGDYPVEAVATMDLIAKAIEKNIDYKDRLQKSILTSQPTVNDAIGISVSQSSLQLPEVKAIIAFTETGGTPKRLCKFRPSVPIIAVSNSEDTCRKLTYNWGVFAAYRKDFTDFGSYDTVAKEVAREFGLRKGDKIIITSGWAQKHGSTNTFRIIDVY